MICGGAVVEAAGDGHAFAQRDQPDQPADPVVVHRDGGVHAELDGSQCQAVRGEQPRLVGQRAVAGAEQHRHQAGAGHGDQQRRRSQAGEQPGAVPQRRPAFGGRGEPGIAGHGQEGRPPEAGPGDQVSRRVDAGFLLRQVVPGQQQVEAAEHQHAQDRAGVAGQLTPDPVRHLAGRQSQDARPDRDHQDRGGHRRAAERDAAGGRPGQRQQGAGELGQRGPDQHQPEPPEPLPPLQDALPGIGDRGR